jgi:hypothetical protein
MVKQKKNVKKLSKNSASYTCKHCGFVTNSEKRYVNHNCKQKIRFELRDTNIGILAFDMWKILGHLNDKIENFEKCRSYNSFMTFANLCIERGYFNPLEYTQWLIRNKVAQKKWDDRKIYEQFLKQYLITENSRDAVARSLVFIESKKYLGSFFKDCPVGNILTYIETGQVSPWLILLYPKNYEFLLRLKDEKLEYFKKLVNIDVWTVKVNRLKKTSTALKHDLEGMTI